MSSLPPPPPPPASPPPGSVPPPPPAAVPPPFDDRAGQQPWWKRKMAGVPVWLLVAVLVVLAIVAAIVVTSGGDDEAVEPSTPTTLDTVPSTEPQDTVAPDDTVATDDTAPTDTGPPVTDPAPNADEVAGAPAGERGDRNSPVTAGSIADIGGGWRLQVLDVIADGTALVAAESEFNDPPPAGSAFTLVKVAMGYYGLREPVSTFEPTISAVGGASVELPADCGLIPDEVDLFRDAFAGGVIVGNLCFVTKPADIDALQLYATGESFGDVEVFLAALPPAALPTVLPTLAGPQDGADFTDVRRGPNALGTAVDVGDGWTVTVTGAARDITDIVLADNSFNDPPPDGYRFVGVDVNLAYGGAGAAAPFDVSIGLVPDGNIAGPQECGSVPGEPDLFADVFAGGSVAGTLCFVVPAGEVTTGVVYATVSFGETYQFLATK